MTDLPPLHSSDFDAFFKAVHQHDPFPWQTRLAHIVAADGWPSVLDLPTGTGKTAALDVAVFMLALGAGVQPGPAARRIVFVVDRRTIVDQAFERAKTIRAALESSSDSVVGRVRERLASLSVDGRPLEIALLRGGIARDDGWARTPDQPLIAVSTVDQVGSRLLFRGYGVTDGMKPVHAGLLGHDVLYLLDEVHLSQPFRETLSAVAGRYRTWASRALPGPFIVVEMSATPGDAPAARPFSLDDVDRAHPRLAQRLSAAKPAVLRSTNARGFQAEIEKQVLKMLARPGATVAVVVNRVKSARDIHQRLREVIPSEGGDVHLLTGRMRPFDRDLLEKGVLQRIRAGRSRSADDRPTVVVATQSIEAGADFDFDGLVSECASLDALRQRFGRLDRFGELDGTALGAVVARTDTLKDDPVYGQAIGLTWQWLEASATDGVVDFGIQALSVPADAESKGLLSPKPHAPVLLPSHLDAWVQTAPMPDPDPDVALWLHGPNRGAADVQVVWRADLSAELLQYALTTTEPLAASASEIAVGMVEASRPGASEAMSVPFLAAKRWLLGQPEPETSDVEGASTEEDEERVPVEQPPRAAVLWQGDNSRVIAPSELRPGQTVVVPSSYGGIAHANWAPASTEDAVRDIAELAVGRYRRQLVVRLHPEVLRHLAGSVVDVPRPVPLELDSASDRDVVVRWLENLIAQAPETPLHVLAATLLGDRKAIRVERLPSRPGVDPAEYFVVRGRAALVDHNGNARETEDGTSASFSGAAVTLSAHLSGVAEAVAAFAEQFGLPEALRRDLRLAAEWHDAGKADWRFQRWLHGGGEFKALAQPEPLAKGRVRLGRAAMTSARERSGYPKDTRHEVMSVALMNAAGPELWGRAQDGNLVWHLVASHHGHCRALAPWVPDPMPVQVGFDREGISVQASSAHDLTRLDSGVAERFWDVVRTYGWWGAAWLEAMFRLADHRQSEREQRRTEKNR